MFPVLAEQEIQLAELRRQERLAMAERDRLIKAQAAASDSLPLPAALLRPAWSGLGGVRGVFDRFGVARSARPSDEVAAIGSV